MASLHSLMWAVLCFIAGQKGPSALYPQGSESIERTSLRTWGSYALIHCLDLSGLLWINETGPIPPCLSTIPTKWKLLEGRSYGALRDRTVGLLACLTPSDTWRRRLEAGGTYNIVSVSQSNTFLSQPRVNTSCNKGDMLAYSSSPSPS